MPAPDNRPLPDSGTSRLPSLTGLRFIAAFLVLLSHAGGFLLTRGAGSEKDYASYLFDAGNKGVSFFFILSGFVLTWVARPGDTRLRFWRRRLVKVFPNHLVTLAATVALMIYTGVAVTAANTVPTLFLVQSWIPDFDVIQGPGVNTPSWSLACELLFYLAFPWLLLAVRRIREEHLWRWVGGATLAIFAVPLIAQLTLPGAPLMQFDPIPWWDYWFVYYFPVPRLLEFVLGILVARIVLDKRWIGLRLGPAMLIAAAAFVAAAYLPGEYGRVAPTALPLALVIAAAATADAQGRRTPFSGRVMVWLGEISYAFYIVHFLVVSYGPIGIARRDFWMKVWTPSGILRDTVLTFAITLVLAWLLHTLVERPAMRRWSRARPPVAPTPTPSPTLATATQTEQDAPEATAPAATV
ncbi:acyltransferase family protein [Streptomyces sp. H27-D2]|uniref:acyltransferase family protein n=1 Tax=Streptomyces sp. H27-D2 TaxID=3046304 RepID=UPI002DBBBAF5|nr:acyltransferase [Streptomyces sp. H27-D2]MEC4017337.1 acyltransferase [Streptomyces sp. H27-D2]